VNFQQARKQWTQCDPDRVRYTQSPDGLANMLFRNKLPDERHDNWSEKAGTGTLDNSAPQQLPEVCSQTAQTPTKGIYAKSKKKGFSHIKYLCDGTRKDLDTYEWN